jgi:23S rRNA G2445 N2-methylase RlmL
MSKLHGLAIPHKGCEDICAAEAHEILGNGTVSHGLVRFESTLLDMCSYTYRAQTPIKVLQLLFDFPINGDVVEQFKKHFTSDMFAKDATFVVRALTDLEEVERQALEHDLGAVIFKTGAKVNFKQPDITFFALVHQHHFFFGIDLSGDELGRRDYRIFLGQNALKGTLAASLVRLSGYSEKHLFLDPFCRDGIIPLEAALLINKQSPHIYGKDKFLFRRLPSIASTNWDAFFDAIDKHRVELDVRILAMDPNFASISGAKKNAKIAGVSKTITFSRTDLDFLDAKFGKKAIDTIVTYVPQVTSALPQIKADSVIKNVFYQAEFVMKSKGTAVFITQTCVDAIKKYAEEFKFTLEHERQVYQGQAMLTVFVFRR